MDTDPGTLGTLGTLAGTLVAVLAVLGRALRRALRPDRVSYHLEIHRDAAPLEAPDQPDPVSRL